MKKLLLVSALCAFGCCAEAKEDPMKAKLAKDLNDVAVMRMQKGDVGGAIEKWEEALAVDPNCGEALRNFGKVLLAGKQYDKAEKVFGIGYSQDPNDMRYVVPLAQVYALRGKMVPFGEMLSRIASASDKSLLRELPILLHKQGTLKAAEVAADRAILEFPNVAECRFNKGVVCEKAGDLPVAEANYRQAKTLQPDYFDAIENLGNVLYAQKKTDEAIVELRKAHALQPDASISQYNLGRILVLSGRDIREGLSLLNRAQKAKDATGAQARALLAELVKTANEKGGAK